MARTYTIHRVIDDTTRLVIRDNDDITEIIEGPSKHIINELTNKLGLPEYRLARIRIRRKK